MPPFSENVTYLSMTVHGWPSVSIARVSRAEVQTREELLLRPAAAGILPENWRWLFLMTHSCLHLISETCAIHKLSSNLSDMTILPYEHCSYCWAFKKARHFLSSSHNYAFFSDWMEFSNLYFKKIVCPQIHFMPISVLFVLKTFDNINFLADWSKINCKQLWTWL